MSETTSTSTTEKNKSEDTSAAALDTLLDDALSDFKNAQQSETAVVDKEPSVSNKPTSSSETAPPPSDPLQSAFEAMCFNDEKFLSELDSLPNEFANFPFGLGAPGAGNESDNTMFTLFAQLGKHAELLQKIKDEDIEKALERLAETSGTASATTTGASSTTNEPHVDQLNIFMSSILSKDVMLPACQAVAESYEEWLSKNKNELTEEDAQRYAQQHECVKEICRDYETSSDDNQQLHRILQKFQQLQTFGDPPKELLFFPGFPSFSGLTGGENTMFGDAFADADKVGQNDQDCCLM